SVDYNPLKTHFPASRLSVPATRWLRQATERDRFSSDQRGSGGEWCAPRELLHRGPPRDGQRYRQPDQKKVTDGAGNNGRLGPRRPPVDRRQWNDNEVHDQPYQFPVQQSRDYRSFHHEGQPPAGQVVNRSPGECDEEVQPKAEGGCLHPALEGTAPKES